jgi:tRNA threonylcarbamoyladenosine biosynthesis protein TsaE
MLTKIRVKTDSEEETITVGKTLGVVLQPGDLITLKGNLGSGKTRLAKGIISGALGTPIDDVISPSFTLVNRYEGDLIIDHADLYRVGPQAIEELGLMEVVYTNGALLIEWAPDDIPILDSELRVTILNGESEDSRALEFEYEVLGSWDERFPEEIRNRSD